MQYALDKITTTDACDALLTVAEKKKRKLERQRRNLGESIGDFRERMDYIEKESVRVQTSLDALNVAYLAMPEGKEKMTVHIMIKRLEVRQAMLAKQAYTCNVATLLVKELRYNHLDSQVAAMEEYVEAVQYWRSTLKRATARVDGGTVFSPSLLLRFRGEAEKAMDTGIFKIQTPSVHPLDYASGGSSHAGHQLEFPVSRAAPIFVPAESH